MIDYFKNNKFDIFPLVFPVGEKVEFCINSTAKRKIISEDITLKLVRIDAGSPKDEFFIENGKKIDFEIDESGTIKFDFLAELEGEHFVRIFKGEERVDQLSVYAVDGELAKRIPLRGDFHVHTTGSDGAEDPQITCANYRRHGYDFMFVTDHYNYYSSLDAIAFYKGVNIALNIMPGEEVHVPGTGVHIVNAGGLFSVNGLLPIKTNYSDYKGELSLRRFDSSVNPPDIYKMEDYWAEIDDIEKGLKNGENAIPETVDAKAYAACLWAFDKIKKADGLAIFAHPYWICDAFNVPENLTKYMLKNHPFDAFEVLGGENYFAQNGFQTAIYYDEYLKGRVHPIVGSTDSHGSTSENRNWDICSTIVFAKANQRQEIISAVKDKFSVAVDTISKEYRIVGEFRFIKYASFLLERYFPIHDKQAYLDGEITRQYALGNATKEEVESLAKRADKLIEKYIRLKNDV